MADHVRGENWLPTVCGCTTAEFWQRVDEDFWINLEPMPDGHELMRLAVDRVGWDSIGVMTSPANLPKNWSGKATWVQKHYPRLYNRLLIGKPKHFCARPTTLLVEDWEKNRDEFIENGGHSILIPRPWNDEHEQSDQAVSVFESRLNALTFRRERDGT